jgi:hypothetical protein
MNTQKVIGIITAGVGKVDYSTRIDSEVNPSASPAYHQRRSFNSGRVSTLVGFVPPTLTYPDIYWLIIGDWNRAGQFIPVTSTDVDTFIQQAVICGDTNATTVVVLAEWDGNFTIAGDLEPPLDYIAWKFAPKVAEIKFSKGHRRTPGKGLALGLAHYSANPTADMTLFEEDFQDVLQVPHPLYL